GRGWRRRPSAPSPRHSCRARPASSPGGRGPSRCGRYWRDRPAGRWSTRLPGSLPVPHALAEVLPLVLGPLVEALAEVGAGRLVETLAERVREERGQLLGVELAIRLDAADGLGQRHQGVAVAEGMEDLPVDVAGALAGQVDHERRHVVRIALGADGLLARPLPGLL